MATNQTQLSMRGRSRAGRFRSASSRGRARRPSRSASRRRTKARRTSRGLTRKLPPRAANGRFTRRRVRAARRREPVQRTRRMPATSIVREASRLSVAGPALVKRRWWRVDGPVDPSLPDGYAYDR